MRLRTPVPAGALTVFVFLVALGACDNPPTGPGSINEGLRLELTDPSTIAPAQLAEYRLVAVSAGGSARDVSLEAEWRSSTEAVIAIASPGRAAAQQPGEAMIAATYHGQTATIAVFVVPAGTFALKGTVRDRLTDLIVAGARVQALLGNAVVLETTSGADGGYQLYGVPRSSELRVSKEGYLDDHRPLEIVGHTTLDLLLRRSEATPSSPVDSANARWLPAPAVPPRSTDPIVGRYTLDIAVAATSEPRCQSVPAYATRRTYTADIHDLGDHYVVNLYDATFLADGTRVSYGCVDRRLPYDGACHQFLMSRDGSSTLLVTITPEDDWRGSEIWEVLPDGHLLQIHGRATGSARDDRLEAAGTGGLWYGDGLPASTVFACGPGELRLTLTRR